RQEPRRVDGAAEGAEGGAILRRNRIDALRRAQAASASHVLRHDRGPAGDMFTDVAGDEPAVEVVAATDAIADDQVDGLAAIEFLDSLGMPRTGLAEAADYGCEYNGPNSRLLMHRPEPC